VRSPVGQWADAHGIEVLTPARPREQSFVDRLAELAPDCVPVVAYGALVPPVALAVPRHGWINLHFSLLPAWRGAAPVQHAVLHGDELTGAAVFQLEEGLDTGPVYGTLVEKIGARDTAGDLLDRLAVAGAGLLVSVLDAIGAGTARAVPQPAEGISLAPKITVADAEVRWTDPAFAVDRRVRACTPAPGAWTTFRGERLKISPVRLVPAASPDGTPAPLSGPDAPAPGSLGPGSLGPGSLGPGSLAPGSLGPGSLAPGSLAPGSLGPGSLGPGSLAPGEVRVERDRVLVGTATGPVELGEVGPAGRKAMRALDWARGARLDPSERLG
jgi:methionyl-tRNA formyltransferase